MQVDRARALRSEDTVENCSLSRRVARVAVNSKNGGREVRECAEGVSWNHRRFFFIGSPRLENLTVSYESGGHMQPRGAA